jgi:ribonuclease D
MITTTEALTDVCTRLAAAEFVAVDTEFMRETTFWPKLCLVQLASPDDAVIVDAMAPGLDLAPFLDLMRDASVLKVFHAGRQDIEIVYHRGGFVPAPIFDTQIAAMVCGFGDSIAYDQLVARTSGGRIDKTHRFTDWSRRPLSDLQLDYALADVTHLRDVYRHLRASLEKSGRIDWVAEEMAVLTSTDTYRVEPETAWTRFKARPKSREEFAVLQAVAGWREREAQTRDVPRSRVLKDDAVSEVATRRPRTAEQLTGLRTVPKGFERSRSGVELVSIVNRALEGGLPDLPPVDNDRPTGNGGAASELLKVLLKLVAERHGVAAKIIATSDDLDRIASSDDAGVPALSGWRRELFGLPALDLKNGRSALAMNSGRIILLERTGTDGESLSTAATTASPSKRRKRRRRKAEGEGHGAPGDANAAPGADPGEPVSPT